jgi:hypothetical protein
MSSLVWRQYRAPAAIAFGLLAAFTALLAVTGTQMASQWHSALVTCTATDTCANLSNTLFLGSHTVGFLVIMTLGVPLVLGMLFGAPLVAHEFETGTSSYAWTQSITRRRWLAIKAGWLLLCAGIAGGIVAGLVTWWSGPDNALQGDAFGPGRFDIMGVIPVVYTVFAMALGILFGTLLRRTLPAIGLTVAAYFAVRVLIDEVVRPHYLAAVTHVYGLLGDYTPAGAVWQLGAGVVAPGGHLLPMQGGTNISPNVSVSAVPAACWSPGAENHPDAVLSCMRSAGYRQYVTFQPASHYWAFQGIEAGVFLALTAAVLAVTFAVVARRDA